MLFKYTSEEAPVGFFGGFWFRLGELWQPAPVLVFRGFEDFSSFLEFELPNGSFKFLNLCLELRPAGAAVYLAVEPRGLKSLRSRRRERPIIILGSELEELLISPLAVLAGHLGRLGLLLGPVEFRPE